MNRSLTLQLQPMSTSTYIDWLRGRTREALPIQTPAARAAHELRLRYLHLRTHRSLARVVASIH